MTTFTVEGLMLVAKDDSGARLASWPGEAALLNGVCAVLQACPALAQALLPPPPAEAG